MSEILGEMNTLSNEFAVLRGSEDDLVQTIDRAISDVREMIGDEFGDNEKWIIAARSERTRAQLCTGGVS